MSRLTSIQPKIISRRPRLDVVKFVLYVVTVESWHQEIRVISIFMHFIHRCAGFQVTGINDKTCAAYRVSLHYTCIDGEWLSNDTMNIGIRDLSAK